jgi:hypothetical protein
MVRLAEEFGITGNGLAKICERLDVPYPPRGHWAKKEAGKPVITLKLPPRRERIPSAADMHPTPPKPAPSPQRKKPPRRWPTAFVMSRYLRATITFTHAYRPGSSVTRNGRKSAN